MFRWRTTFAAVCVAGALASAPASRATSQTVSPSIVQMVGRARTSLVISNDGLYPLAAILELRGFSVDSVGNIQFTQLDTSRIHVALSAMSARLGAKQRITVFYDASATQLPAWFAIVVGFSAGRPQPGLNVRMEVPQFVYLVQPAKLEPGDVAVRRAEYDSTTRHVSVVVANTSGKYGRALQVSLATARGRPRVFDACPIFPHSQRWFDVLWTHADIPVRVALRFDGFAIEHDVAVTGPLIAAGRGAGTAPCSAGAITELSCTCAGTVSGRTLRAR
jgi:hypothetical protein